MKVNVISSADRIDGESLKGKVAIVIDVLRATSVMVTAIANGAKAIYPFEDSEDLKNSAKKDIHPILAGERGGIKIEGFDFGNSPLEFKSDLVKDKNIYMSTTNGTRALVNSSRYCNNIYIGSFLNMDAVVKLILERKEDVTFVCSGTNNEFSLDDALCAGMMIYRVSQLVSDLQVDDLGIALQFMGAVSNTHPLLHQRLKDSKHYNILKSLGFLEDLDYCLSLNKFDIVPQFVSGCIMKCF